MSDNIKGVAVSFTGVLTDVTPEAVVVTKTNPDRDHWIPLDSILFIQFDVPMENPANSQQTEH